MSTAIGQELLDQLIADLGLTDISAGLQSALAVSFGQMYEAGAGFFSNNQLAAVLWAVPNSKASLEAAGITDFASVGPAIQTAKDNAGTDDPDETPVDPGVPGVMIAATTGTDLISPTQSDPAFKTTADNDTIIAGESAGTATFTVGDFIDGGAGNDTMNWTSSLLINGIPTGAEVKNVETVNVVSGAAITLNTTSNFEGMTQLNTTTSGFAQTITAKDSTNVGVTAGAQAATAVAVSGGKDVTVDSTLVDLASTAAGGAIGVTGAKGAVVINQTATSANVTDATTATGSAVTVNGGTSVTVDTSIAPTAAAAQTVKTANETVTATHGAVNVTGNADTTSVSVTQAKAVAAVSSATDGVVGIINGAVTIADVNAGSATEAGVIETVTLDSYGNSKIDSGALETINLMGTGGTLDVDAGLLTTPVVDTLAFNVEGLTAGLVDLDADYKTLNLMASGDKSTVANITGTGVTALNFSGDGKLNLTAQTFAAAKDIISTNTAGVSLGTVLATDMKFTGGDGDDAILIGVTTKAINMGAGNDTVTISNETLGAGGSVNGGTGVNTIVANTNGSTLSANANFSNFQTLQVAGGGALGAHNATGFTALELGTTAGASSFTNVAAGVGLTVLAGPTGGNTVTLANAAADDNVFDLALESDAALTAGSITIAGVETINIANTDTETVANPTAQTNTLTLVATSAETVTVTGNAGLDLTNTGNVAITNFDASGIQGAAADAAALAVTFVSANTTVAEAVTIKGGSGNDLLTGGAATYDTIYGGAGNDTLTYLGGKDVFYGEAGDDTFVMGGGSAVASDDTNYLTLADASKDDKIDFSNVSTGTIANTALGAKVTLGSAATFAQYLDAAAAGDGGTNALVTWFQFENDTYVVLDNTAGVDFAAGDAVIKLAGVSDLSDSTLATEVLTIV